MIHELQTAFAAHACTSARELGRISVSPIYVHSHVAAPHFESDVPAIDTPHQRNKTAYHDTTTATLTRATSNIDCSGNRCCFAQPRRGPLIRFVLPDSMLLLPDTSPGSKGSRLSSHRYIPGPANRHTVLNMATTAM